MIQFQENAQTDGRTEPGPIQNDQLLKENWKIFERRGLNFIHLNINSSLPKQLMNSGQ